MYHIVYLTTNLVNLKFYVGVHSTWNLDDGYLGSGKHLKNSIKKYGEENFKRKILFICLEESHAYKIEEDIVNDIFVKRKDTYNIKLGGSGSFSHVNNNKDVYSSEYFRNKYFEKFSSLSEADQSKFIESRKLFGSKNPSFGRKRTKDEIDKMKHVGDNNPNSYSYLKNIRGLSDEEIKEERKKHRTLKSYKIISPNNIIIHEGEISLKEFCLEYNFTYYSVSQLVKGNKIKQSSKLYGWTILCIP